VKRVEIPSAAVRKSLPRQRKSYKKVEIPVAAGRISLPKQRKPAKRVEIPVVAGWKSLPKQRKSVEKGRDSKFPRSQISTQIAEIDRKG